MKFVCCLITVKNIEKSRFLYENILGQTIKYDFGENVIYDCGLAIHKRDHFQKLVNLPPADKPNNFELYFEEDELEGILNVLMKEGFELIHGIIEQPWKQKVIRFYDYDDNIVEIGEKLEHVAYRLSKEGRSAETISRMTNLPEKDVLTAINEYSGKEKPGMEKNQ